jgi:hypothetical protein
MQLQNVRHNNKIRNYGWEKKKWNSDFESSKWVRFETALCTNLRQPQWPLCVLGSVRSASVGGHSLLVVMTVYDCFANYTIAAAD